MKILKFLPIIIALLLLLCSCASKKACEKKYGDWIAKLKTDTLFFTDTIYIPPIVLLDTINITNMLHDTTLMYCPVFKEDPEHKVRLTYWTDKYQNLFISCQKTTDTIFVQGERVIVTVEKDPPENKGIGTFWEIVIVLTLILALMLTGKAIINKFT